MLFMKFVVLFVNY